MTKDIEKIEFRFAIHLPKESIDGDDVHLVKELIHYKTGEKEPRLNIIRNFKRKVYVTKPAYRNYKDKKEYEPLSRLIEIETTESDMFSVLKRHLDSTYPSSPYATTMIDLSPSPYLYGSDVKSTTILNYEYKNKYPGPMSLYSLAVFDIEVDTTNDEIIVASLCLNNKIYVSIKESLLINKIDIEAQLLYLMEKYIPKTDISKNIEAVFNISKSEVDLLKWVFSKCHEEQPDLVAVWNINYDIPHILKRLEHFNIDPKDIFCDPNLPNELKTFKYIEGSKSKTTSSGVFKPKAPHERWHTIVSSSSFYWVDAMSVYHFVRLGAKNVPGGYSLDNILSHELGGKLNKLKFKDDPLISRLKGLEWHRYMVANRPLEYIIYNIWDTMSILELENKTKDMTFNLPILSGYSNFSIFNSNPRRLLDEMYFFYLENGLVMGVSDKKKMVEKRHLGLSNWVVALPIERISEQGLKLISEDKNIATNLRGHVYDSDQVSGYPNDTIAANVSIATTDREILDVDGIDIELFKEENMNIMFGAINSIQYCTNIFNFPEIKDLKLM